MTKLMCPEVESVKTKFPILFCLGAMGPCNGANYQVPETDKDGIPKNFKDVANFYNTAKFSEILPELKRMEITPPCYETCRAAVDVFIRCPQMSRMFDATHDTCAGLPKSALGEECAEFPGPKGGIAETSEDQSAAKPTGKPSTPATKPQTPEKDDLTKNPKSDSVKLTVGLTASLMLSVLLI